MITNFINREMEIAAISVIPEDELSLARFYRECTPERILFLIENFSNKDLYKSQEFEEEISSLEEEISDLKDNIYHLELKLEKEIERNR